MLREIHAAVATGEPTELVGEPGIGKTTLLRNVAHHLAELRGDGVVYTRAAGLPASDVLQFLFETFYDTGGTTVVATPAQLSQLLGPVEALILVDDVELVREELEDLTNALPGCTVVAGAGTQQLWGEGTSLPVPGLDDRRSAHVAGARARPSPGRCRAGAAAAAAVRSSGALRCGSCRWRPWCGAAG